MTAVFMTVRIHLALNPASRPNLRRAPRRTSRLASMSRLYCELSAGDARPPDNGTTRALDNTGPSYDRPKSPARRVWVFEEPTGAKRTGCAGSGGPHYLFPRF
jgi:hypothetical protein